MNPNRGWKIATVCLGTMLVGLLAFSAYHLLDQGITITYMESSLDLQGDQIELLCDFAPQIYRGRTKADVLSILRELRPDEIISDEREVVSISNLAFHFDENGLLDSISNL